MEKKTTAKKWLLIALSLCLISMVLASGVQNGFGKVEVKDLRFETTAGRTMSGLLFVPKNASAETPAPAIVVSHGMYNNREMQDLNFVELSRRGYVVLSMDMFSHGHSQSNTDSVPGILIGMYEAVKMMSTLPYVDASRIGITGHSLGGMSSNMAITLDNAADQQLISAVLLNSADATYVDADGAYQDVYGTRDVAVLAGQYDEFFFMQDDGNGGKTAPRDYIDNSNAQSFLHFGQDPQGLEMREPYTLYTQEIDGQEAIRAVYNPAIIHPWSHFSKQSTEITVDFFEAALGAPSPLAGSNQIWQWKAFFNMLGLIGIAMFMVSFAILMVHTPAFASLRAKKPVEPLAIEGKNGKLWFFGSMIISAIFAGVVYLPILYGMTGHSAAKGVFNQSSPVGVGMWAAACGLFAIVMMVLSYRMNGKKNGFSLRERGVSISFSDACKTIALAILTVFSAYLLVFIADFFFKVDYRLWVIGIKTFGPDKLAVMLFPTLLLFLLYYVANSVAVNSFNYNRLGKKEWVNTAVVAIFNVLPVVVLLLLQYVTFYISGHLMPGFSNMYIVWLFPMLVYLPVSAIMARKVYRATNNPYLPGLINGLMIAIISCTNTLTWM